MISRPAVRLSGILLQCYPGVLYARHSLLPSELFNNTLQSGRFGCTSAGAHLFLGNAVPEALRAVKQVCCFPQAPASKFFGVKVAGS